MKHVILGTAGHVDHGKTALVKALTGIDTDRLKEEKERGITIDLGFAFLHLPSGKTIGIVDVPGHERFVKNMVAGATGIDCVVLVIAADEGVMPQTREHLAICSLLGVKKGLVALTKVDLVEKEWLALVTDEVREFTRGTFLEGAPIVPVSSVTGEGIEAFLVALDDCISKVEAESDSGVFRLPVDRVFTVKGFGTVLTGTIASGHITVGEEVVILPSGRRGKVRGIQNHGIPVERAYRGQRAAVNISGWDKSEAQRGDVLCRPGTLTPTHRLDTLLEFLPSNERDLKTRQLVRLHVGTCEVMARVVIIGRESVRPGEAAYAQLFLERPTAVMAQDRFVIRSYSPITTIGGGLVLDPLPKKYRKGFKGYEEELAILRQGEEEERVKVIVDRGGWAGVSLSELVMRTGIGISRLKTVIEALWSRQDAVVIEDDEKRSVSGRIYQLLQGNIREEIASYHEKNPLKEGVPKEELRQLLGGFISPRLFNRALAALEKSGVVTVERELVRLSQHRVSLDNLKELRQRLEDRYLRAGLMPPTRREVLEGNDAPPETEVVLELLTKEGVLVKVSEELYFHKEAIQRLWEDYRTLLLREGKATPLSFKEMTGLTRKFIIPLMEYFDAQKLTIRTGDYRILRGKG
ncbi:MAG TPA: selenocysteine-specific translation elongation factor [Syntrophales bacterium]|nr:selenocysteine-specific translation elongation factor [Syntrophales bacterium]HOL58332.1 selenocysteine-specific translation elongation factor [Syntrophales bacterium]HPO34501.1 selenocysteine-specific translation elongation factor [Syntrophales bacterium]